ncbi:conserved membrane domain protein [Mycobacterium kansasii]|uniref:Conserved membrane domain protein n=1 Tax=Mycobacterium kansasii TaxID=1768 RepID=A0A1V3X549_MYCKA|nr:conserved membrane domain protein [Mycobacterium kansasii]
MELAEMIAESVSEGLLDPEEHTRLTRALRIRTRVVADVAVPVSDIRSVPVAAVGSARRSARSNRRWPRPASRGTRWWIAAHSSGTCTSRTCWRWAKTTTP